VRAASVVVSPQSGFGATIVEGLTPVDAALGKAGGHGRGQTTEVHQDTADSLVALCGQQKDCDLAAPDGLAGIAGVLQ